MRKVAPLETLTASNMCKKHRMWMKKGGCSACRTEEIQRLNQYKQERGIVDVPLKVIKL
jgi:hypothetical protein